MEIPPTKLNPNPPLTELDLALAAQLDYVLAAAGDLGILPVDPEEAEKRLEWRMDVYKELDLAGRFSDAEQFRICGEFIGNFNVAVCADDVEHEVRAIPYTCHKRYCPDCECRAAARRVAKLLPRMHELAELNSPMRRFRKVELTTSFRLGNPNAPELYREAWGYVESWLQSILMELLIFELTPEEKRRGRVDLKRHDIGVLIAAEFGGKGRKLHFHILIYGPFMPKEKITDHWMAATSGAFHITWVKDIERDEVDDSVHETLKYVTKFTELPPALVPALADVLDGQRRFRTYGLFRFDKDNPAPEEQPHVCNACGNDIEIITVREYFERSNDCNVEPDRKIVALARDIFLDLRHGNKSGEVPLPRSDPDPALTANLPGFDAVFNPGKWS